MADTIPVIWGQTSDGKDAYVKTCTAGVYNPETGKPISEEMVTMQASPAVITGETPIKPVCDALGNVICPQTRTEAVYDPESGQTLDKVIHPAYSTEEQWTGKYWIDGKKIYEKVIYGTSAAINNSVNLPIGVFVETFAGCYGYANLSGAIYPLDAGQFEYSLRNHYSTDIQDSIRITTPNNSSFVAKPLTVIVNYTKITE